MTSRKTLILAVVTEILDTAITYPSCVNCYSKLLVDPTTNRYHCVKCGSNCDKHKVQWRYRLVISISDQTSAGRVVVFGRCLDGFFGKTATDFTKSLDDLEQTGYPAKSMLLEALLQTFLGKYFYFGFKLAGNCDTFGAAALKDVLNIDTSLVHSQLDCTSHFDTYHTLAYQMLSSSDAVFASVTDHMRNLVKQLRTGCTSIVCKTQVNPCDKKNQSNKDISPQNKSTSISGAPSFELGLDSVHFSFESKFNLTSSVKKFEKLNGIKVQIDRSLNYLENHQKDSKDFQLKEIESSHTTNHLKYFSYVTIDTLCDDLDDVSNFSTDNFSYVDIHTDMCETLSDIPVTQKLLFDSPNVRIQSNTSQKIDKELYRREMINSLNTYPVSQISCLSRTNHFCQETFSTTKNCMNSGLSPNRATTDGYNTFGNMCGMGFLHNGNITDFKPKASVSLIRNDLAAEFAMPESEDLNAFFDSEFDGFVLTQDKEDTSETSNCSVQKVTNSTDVTEHVGNEASENTVGNLENYGQTAGQLDRTGQDVNIPEECSGEECSVYTSEIENMEKGFVRSYEHLSNLDNQLTVNKDCSLKSESEGISKSFCENMDLHISPASDTFSDSFDEECFIKNDLKYEQKTHVAESLSPIHVINTHSCNVSPVTNIEDENKADGESKDLEHLFADISKYEIDKQMAENEKLSLFDKLHTENQKEKDSLVENDLEQFFNDISNYEIDNHYCKHDEKASVDDLKNDEKQLSEDVVLRHLYDSNEVECQGNEFMNCVANDMDVKEDSLWVANTPEFNEQTPEVKDHVGSADSMFKCNGQLMKSDNSEERFSSNEGSSSCHFDFLTSCSSISTITDGSCKQAKTAEKSPILDRGLLNSTNKNSRKTIEFEVLHDSDKIDDCDHPVCVYKTDNKAESPVSILAASSFDASNDLFDFEVTGEPVSGNDSLDKCVIVNTLVEDSLHDENVLKTGPLKASTPGSDHALIVDSLEYVVVESDSEVDFVEDFDEKKLVKFDRKLRRVSCCNFMDLKMKVNNSPLVSLDQNILLKSCLKRPRNLNLQKAEKKSIRVQNSELDKRSAKCNEEVLTSSISGLHSNSDNASIDLFADSFNSPECGNDVTGSGGDFKDCKTKHFPVNTSQKVDSFCEHWSEDVSDKIFLGADSCDEDNKENNLEMNKMKLDTVEILPKGTESCRLPASKQVQKCVEMTDSWIKQYSVDIFEDQSGKIGGGSNSAKVIGCIKSEECKTDQERCNVPDNRVRGKLNEPHCVLKCLVLNTSSYDRFSYSRTAQKNKNTQKQSNEDKDFHTKKSSFYSPDLFGDSFLEIDNEDNFVGDKIKTNDCDNNTPKNKKTSEESYDDEDFNAQQSRLYSPDLFGDSILDNDDIDDIVCDKTNDVLCKKLLF